MGKEEIDKNVEVLLKKLLTVEEFKTLKKIVESRGNLSLEEVD